MTPAAMYRAEARLIVLKALAEQVNYSLNESLLQQTLETFGIHKPRDWVREELNRLADLGAVSVQIAGSVMVATATAKGLDHVERRLVIEGIKRPSPQE